ncbi:MAG: TolC family protein [Planctomycetota bacterium]|nr:MAG: TolC family protein [Planctomycetota bacterium]
MLCNFRLITLLCGGLCTAIILGMTGACSPEYYKAEADEEVYNIIDSKWQGSFGRKANYTVSDVPPSPNDIQIEEPVPSSKVLSLAKAVAIATAHNRDYQKQKEDLYLKALDLTLERHQFARQWFGTIDAKYLRHPVPGRDNDEEELKISGDNTKLGFTQLLADGAIVSAGIGFDWARFLTGDPSTSLGSVLSASITQPLLRGAGRRIAQENLTQSERNALYEIRSFNRFRQEFVVSIVNDYYRVLQQRDKVTNAENNYKRVLKSKERLEMELKAGIRTRIDVDETEQNVLRAQNNYVEAQQRYEQSLDEFKIRLSLPTDADIELDQNELNALEKIGISEPNYTPDAAIETALLQRLDLANTRDQVDDAVRKVIVTADGLGAELNLTGGIDVGSREKTDIDSLQFHDGTYTLGLSGDLPLDRKEERNIYRTAIIALERQQREYDNEMDNVKLNVRQAYRQLIEKAETYKIQKLSLDLAERRVESNELLLDAGRVTVRILLESEDALVEAQNNVTAALVDHAIAKLSFFRDVGILQVMPDGMWEQ